MTDKNKEVVDKIEEVIRDITNPFYIDPFGTHDWDLSDIEKETDESSNKQV